MPRIGLSTDRLVHAGAELADEIGFEHVTLSALARSFDVQVASLYSHISSADDLRTRIALLALDELATSACDAVDGHSGIDAIRALGNVHRDYAAAHPGRHDAARFRLSPDAAAASAGPRLARLMRAVLRDYALVEPQETHAVRLLGSVFHGFISLELAGGFSHSEPPSEASWRQILDSLDVLFRSWPEDSPPLPEGSTPS